MACGPAPGKGNCRIGNEDQPATSNPTYKKWDLNDFQIGFPLGSGACGRVYVAKERSTKLMCAIKLILKSFLIENSLKGLLRREIEVHAQLRHPNIIQMYTFFHDRLRLFLVVEYAPGGSVYDLMTKKSPFRFENAQAARYVSQTAAALEYCHLKGVLHRDIKPENLLLDNNGDVKLADFGLSVHSPNRRRQTEIGTLNYRAPEIIRGMEYDARVDIWSLGVLTFELLTGNLPFDHANDERLEEIILTGISFRNFPRYISPSARNFMTKLLRQFPKDRMSIANVQQHKWILDSKDCQQPTKKKK